LPNNRGSSVNFISPVVFFRSFPITTVESQAKPGSHGKKYGGLPGWKMKRRKTICGCIKETIPGSKKKSG
jgi:hypothetical protein